MEGLKYRLIYLVYRYIKAENKWKEVMEFDSQNEAMKFCNSMGGAYKIVEVKEFE